LNVCYIQEEGNRRKAVGHKTTHIFLCYNP